MALILIVDDNALDRKIAGDALAHAGFEVEQASDGPAGLRALFSRRPDLVVLDVMMPGMDGWLVCERIRELSSVPIIMLTSLNREEEMIRGLDLGADDFVSKPVSPAHLVARVRAIRRRTREAPRVSPGVLYRDDALSINVSTHEVRRAGEAVELTPTEFRLLIHLVQTPNSVHSSASLLTAVWGPEYIDDIDFLRVYMWRLRKKIEDDPGAPRWLRTERGFGYRFVASRHASQARNTDG